MFDHPNMHYFLCAWTSLILCDNVPPNPKNSTWEILQFEVVKRTRHGIAWHGMCKCNFIFVVLSDQSQTENIYHKADTQRYILNFLPDLYLKLYSSVLPTCTISSMTISQMLEYFKSAANGFLCWWQRWLLAFWPSVQEWVILRAENLWPKPLWWWILISLFVTSFKSGGYNVVIKWLEHLIRWKFYF